MENTSAPIDQNNQVSSASGTLGSLWKKFKKSFKEPKSRIIYLSIFIAVLLFGFLSYFFSAPVDLQKGTIFKVEEGKTLSGISLDLENAHIIRSRLAFEFFVTLYGGERHIKVGYYQFDGNTPVFEVSRMIVTGDRHLVPIKITFPEGTTSARMADILVAKLPDFNKEKFLTEALNKQGYLFPDTYFFFAPDTEEDVIKELENNFDMNIKPLLPEIAASGRTENQIITLASLLEKEAKGKEDRATISGILLKRISLGMPLQIDAAPETYKKKGLPADPICNPGLGAIKDAIHPESSPYLFYLHDKDGIVHYAVTFAEHQANIKKYLE